MLKFRFAADGTYLGTYSISAVDRNLKPNFGSQHLPNDRCTVFVCNQATHYASFATAAVAHSREHEHIYILNDGGPVAAGAGKSCLCSKFVFFPAQYSSKALVSCVCHSLKGVPLG